MRLLAIAFLLVSLCAASAGAGVEVVSLGEAQSYVVEYDAAEQPVRRYQGLQLPTDVTPLDDGDLLVVDRYAHRVVYLRADGIVAWSEPIAGVPQRARPLGGGGLLVTGIDEVVAVAADRRVLWRLAVPGVVAAAPRPNGNVMIAANDHQGWLREMTTAGEVVWESKPRGYRNERGVWVDEDPRAFFVAIASVDVAADGRVLTADFERHQIRVYSPSLELLETIPGIRHMTDTRFGAGGEIVAASPEDHQVLIVTPGGERRLLDVDQLPMSAALAPGGRLFVGFQWRPENAALAASEARARPRPALPWYQRTRPVALLALLVALASALALRPPSRFALRAASAAGSRPAAAPQPLAPATGRASTLAFWLLTTAAAAALGGGVWLAWQGIVDIDSHGFTADAWRFAAGSMTAGLALRLLNRQAGTAAQLTSFVPASWPGLVPPGGDKRTFLGLGLALAALALCTGVVLRAPAYEAMAIGAWLAAQVWILCAAAPPRAATERASLATLTLLAAVLALAVGLRFWQIGSFPDFVHHDHSIYGNEILRCGRGDCQPFFSRAYSVGRPWFLPALVAIDLFGEQYWILRLTAALSGVFLTLGAYLLGKELFNIRVGVITAFLVCVNQVLLLFSRQPYVIDPAAPFVLALFGVAAGLRRGSRFHWCLAGVLGGWALLGYHASVTYLAVAAAALAYLALFHPRHLWRQRGGLAWLLAGGLVVYLPMFAGAPADTSVADRAGSIIVFFNPDGSIRWDPELWERQVGRSFGVLLRGYPGDAWGVSANRSICLPYAACLFGIGLGYLLTVWRTPATFLLLVWGLLCIFLGSAILPGAPTPYHFLAAVVPVMLAAAVALDRALALTDGWPALLRAVPLAAAGMLLAVIGAGHLQAAWSAVERPPDHADGSPRYRAEAIILAARHIGEHPDYRYYLVRSRTDLSVLSPPFRFFGDRSDLSDISTPVEDVLPIPPVEPARGAAFLVLPSRQRDGAAILARYPDAEVRLLHDAWGNTLHVYVVGADDVRRAHAAAPPAAADPEGAIDGGARR